MKSILILLAIILTDLFFSSSVIASFFREVSFPSYAYNDNILYFNEYTGEIISYSILDNSSNSILTLPGVNESFESRIRPNEIPIDPFDYILEKILVGPLHNHILFYAPNSNLFDSPFYSDNSTETLLWWLYSFENNTYTQLSNQFTSVGWYSDTKIIYVFDDREVAVAPINDLGNFRILTTEVPGSVDPSQRIIANEDHQLIPLEDGYLIGNQGSFTFHRTSGEAQALPSQDRFLIHSSTRIDILDWNGETITSLENLRPLAKALMPSEDSLILLFESGELVLYALDGSVQENVLSKDFISDVSYATVDDPSEIVIVQSGNVFVFNAVRNQIQSVIQDTPDSPIEISTDAPRLQRIGAESFSSIGLFVIGVFLIISMILGLFLWKKRKSTN